jgi:tripeptide aminopeptidase
MNSADINQQQLLDRFLQYVRIGTAANPESDAYPSSPGQLVLGKLLLNQLLSLRVLKMLSKTIMD